MFICRSPIQVGLSIFRQLKVPYAVIPCLALKCCLSNTQFRYVSINCESDIDEAVKDLKNKDHIDASDPDTEHVIRSSVIVVQDFLNEEEEDTLFKEVEPHLKRLRYEVNHWDDAICGYRETERKHWSEESKKILKRVQQFAFAPGIPILPFVHVLDLQKTGYIKPHIDSVRFCGSIIAGLSLLSSSIMRFVHEKDKEKMADVLLGRRSLYIMNGVARYEYTHEILPDELSVFKGVRIPRDRRISIISRNEVISHQT